MYQETRSATPIYARKTLGCVVAVLFSLPLSFGRISHAAAGSKAADFQHSTVVDSMPGSQHSTVADLIRAFANFIGSMTAIFGNSMTSDFITMASAAGLSSSPLSAAGGGMADGVGPTIPIHPEANYGYGPYPWYWCSDPPGYYPYVAQCNTAWQTVPAS